VWGNRGHLGNLCLCQEYRCTCDFVSRLKEVGDWYDHDGWDRLVKIINCVCVCASVINSWTGSGVLFMLLTLIFELSVSRVVIWVHHLLCLIRMAARVVSFYWCIFTLACHVLLTWSDKATNQYCLVCTTGRWYNCLYLGCAR